MRPMQSTMRRMLGVTAMAAILTAAATLMLLTSVTRAQQAAVPSGAPALPPRDAQITYTSAADVQALIAKARSDREPDQANYLQRIVQLPPYNVNLEYRAIAGGPAVHQAEAELFYVIDGSGTLVTGGTLANPQQTTPGNLSGSGINSGTPLHFAKGDWMFVPENTPHQVTAVDSGSAVVFMTFHVPRPAPAKP